jgi:hypothetical protein
MVGLMTVIMMDRFIVERLATLYNGVPSFGRSRGGICDIYQSKLEKKQ